MTRIVSLVSLVVVLVLGSLTSVEAQGRGPYRNYNEDCIVGSTGGECIIPAAGGIYDRSRSYYDPYGDPYYNRGYPYQRPLPQGIEICRYAECAGLTGTFHAEKGMLHFRPYDETNDRLGTEAGGVLASAGGAAIGGVFGGRKGAAIGAVGGAIAGGIIASRHAHDNCIVIESVRSAQFQQRIGQGGIPVPYQEQVMSRPVAGPAGGYDESHGPAYRPGNRPVVNSTAKFVELYDGDRKPENLVGEMAPGDSWDLAKPMRRYRAFAEIPNQRGSNNVDEISPETTDIGWIFVEPTVARQGR